MSTVISEMGRSGAAPAARGQALMPGDLSLPGMLHGALLPADGPRASLQKIDLAEALKVPGVIGAIALGAASLDYAGQPLAAVCAHNAAAARKALARIVVHCTQLEPVCLLEQAVEEGAPQLRDGGNILATGTTQSGDVQGALEAAAQVVLASYRTAPLALAGMEPAACLAAPLADGRLGLWTNRGACFTQRLALAEALGLEPAALRVVCPGAGAAGPWETSMHLAALSLARQTGRPVRLAPGLEAEVAMGLRRPEVLAMGRIGLADNGAIAALDVEVLVDGGANAQAVKAAALTGALPYEIENLRIRVRQVFTNNPPAAMAPAMAAAQLQFAVEGLINEAARQVGLDPLALRLVNVPGGGRMAALLDAAKASWDGGKADGVACVIWPAPPVAEAAACRLSLNTDGSARLALAQGCAENMRALAAAELGLAPTAVGVDLADSDQAPQAPAVSGMAVAPGLAVLDACRRAKDLAPPCSVVGQSSGRSPEPSLGVQIARAEVDAETGVVSAKALSLYLDCGTQPDPTNADTFIRAQQQAGLSAALVGGLRMDGGRARNAAAKRFVGATEMPTPQVRLKGGAHADAPGGGLEIGAAAMIGVAPALAASVAAQAGAVCTSLPMRPEDILRALGRIR